MRLAWVKKDCLNKMTSDKKFLLAPPHSQGHFIFYYISQIVKMSLKIKMHFFALISLKTIFLLLGLHCRDQMKNFDTHIAMVALGKS